MKLKMWLHEPQDGGVLVQVLEQQGFSEKLFGGCICAFCEDRTRQDIIDTTTVFMKDLAAALSREGWVPKRGELVKVSNNGDVWYPRIFLADLGNRVSLRYAAAEDEGTQKHTSGGDDTVLPKFWRFMRPIHPTSNVKFLGPRS